MDKPGAIYFVTACLDGSIPARGLKDIADYRQTLRRRELPTGLTDREWESRKWKLAFARTDDWLDSQPSARHLAEPSLADEVEKALLHFAGTRYAIWSWVVMPSHFHWVFEPLQTWVDSLEDEANIRTPRERVMHSVKRHSARQCNRLRGQTGAFWQDESYDHCIDDVAELERVIDYVELNPMRAELATARETFRFSSAYYRQEKRTPFGQPLVGRSEI